MQGKLYADFKQDRDVKAAAEAAAAAAAAQVKETSKTLLQQAEVTAALEVAKAALHDFRSPVSALNLDVTRLAITFQNPDMLGNAYRALEAGGVGAFRVLRVKNTFRPDFPAREEAGGYRCLLVNVLFEPSSGADGSGPPLTWGDLFALPATEARWAKLLEEETQLQPGMFANITSWAREHLAGTPVRWVGEVQLLLQQYLDMRKLSHLWYKIARADKPRALCYDFLNSYTAPQNKAPSLAADAATVEADTSTDFSKLEEDVLEEGTELGRYQHICHRGRGGV
jgi:hypothetical protein